MSNQNVVRTLTVRGTSDGLDKVASDLTKVADAHGKAAEASTRAASVTETSAKRQLSTANAWDRLRRSVDDAYDAEQKIARADALGRRAAAQGRDIGEVNKVLDDYRRKVLGIPPANDNLGKSAGLAAHQLGNLRSQLFDVATSLQGGASPLTVLSQQGPQIYEALAGSKGLAGGLKDAGATAAATIARIHPLAAVLVAVAAATATAAGAFGRFSSNQRELAIGIGGAGRASGATVGGINRVAESANIAGLSAQSVREMSTEFARTGKIGTDMYADLSRFAKDYAVLSGQDVADATRDLARSFADPAKGAEELNKVIGGLDGRTLDLIETLQASGDRLGAQRVLMGAYGETVRAAGENVSVFSRAWNSAKSTVSDAVDAIGRKIDILTQGGSSLEERLTTAQKILQSSQSRRGIPFIGESDYQTAKKAVDELTGAIEKQKRSSQDAQDAQKTLAGKSAVAAIMPGIGDLQQLETFRNQLQQAFDTGKSVTGTEDALKRIKDLIKAGGTEVYNLARAAKEAFDTAGLLPFQQSIARINNDINERLKTAAPEQVAGLERARRDQLAAARIGAVDVPLRDANTTVTEQVANLKVQRDSFTLGAAAAGEMAARQELINRFARDGVDIMKSNAEAVNAYAKRAGEAAAANENFARTSRNIVSGMDELRSGTQGTITGLFSDLRQGKNPIQGLLSSLGSMTDRLVDRVISKPLTESLLGFEGKPGGGAIGDFASKIFGNAAGITTPTATVNAGVVNVNGAGLGAGLPGGSAASTPGASVADPVSTVATTVGTATGRGRVSVQLGTDPQPSTVTTASLPNPSAVVQPPAVAMPPAASVAPRMIVEPQGMTPAAASLYSVLPSKYPAQDAMISAVAARDADRYGGWSGAAPDPDIIQRMSVGMTVKAEQMAASIGSAGQGTADALTGVAGGIGQSGQSLVSSLGSVANSLGSGGGGKTFTDRLPSLSGLGGGGGGAFSFSGAQTDFMSGLSDLSFFAEGGIMTSRGRLPLNRYSGGGVADRPQVAMFGEGRLPEAYVPLPDGRNIPVSLNVPMPANTDGSDRGGNTFSISHAPSITMTPANGVTPDQLAAVLDRNNKQFMADLPRHMQQAQRRRA